MVTLSTYSTALQDVIATLKITDPGGFFMPVEEGLERVLDFLQTLRNQGGTLYLIGNGGSSAVVAHIANDLVNNSHVRAHTLHDAPLFSCMANDYGYEHAFARILEKIATPLDGLIAVSSSGKSPNMIHAAQTMHAMGGMVLTCSGFSPDNPLRKLGELNLWIDSSHYGLVEVTHLFLLHYVSDQLRQRTGSPTDLPLTP